MNNKKTTWALIGIWTAAFSLTGIFGINYIIFLAAIVATMAVLSLRHGYK